MRDFILTFIINNVIFNKISNLKMKQLVQILGYKIIITPFLKSETNLVFNWRNSIDYQNLCSCRKYSVSYSEFVEEIKNDFLHDRHEQYIIKKKTKLLPIGTIFSYNYNKIQKNIFITTFIDTAYRNSIYGAESHILMLYQLFQRFDICKIYADVYIFNIHSINTLLNGGYLIESVFKKQNSDFVICRFYITKDIFYKKFKVFIENYKILPF